MQICIYKTMIKVYCIRYFLKFFCIVKDGINKKHSLGVSFREKLSEPQHRHVSQRDFRGECSSEPSLTCDRRLSQAWQP